MRYDYQEISIQRYPYKTIDQTLMDNAERHLRNASLHALVGRLDYAVGSIAKALRNFKRAREMRDWLGVDV